MVKSVSERLMERHMHKSPDTKDTVEKIGWITLKAATGLSFLGILDIATLTRPQNIKQGLNCMAYWVVPGTAFVASWVTGLYVTARIRNKEDGWNYMAASFATIPMMRYLGKSSANVFMYFPFVLLGSYLIKEKKDRKSYYLDLDYTRMFGIYDMDMRLSKEEDKYYRSPYPDKC